MKAQKLTWLTVAAVIEMARLERDTPNAGPITIGPLSERLTGKPRSFEINFRKLAAAGILTSVRGIFGGYRLQRRPAEITLWQIIEALDAKYLDFEFAPMGEASVVSAWKCARHALYAWATDLDGRTVARALSLTAEKPE